MNRVRRLNSQKGLTLIETMITIVIVGVVLMSMAIGNAKLRQSAEAAFERTRAITDANHVLETVRRTANTGNFPSNVRTAFPNGGAVAGYTGLTNENITVSYADGNSDGVAGNENPLDLTITVSWLENGRRAASISTRAMVTQK